MRMSELYILTVTRIVATANAAMYAIPSSTRATSPFIRACMAIMGWEKGIAKHTACRAEPHPYHPVNMMTNIGIMARMLRGMVMVWADL